MSEWTVVFVVSMAPKTGDSSGVFCPKHPPTINAHNLPTGVNIVFESVTTNTIFPEAPERASLRGIDEDRR